MPDQTRTASTGPPLIGGGEPSKGRRIDHGGAASTGPPLIGGGEEQVWAPSHIETLLQRVRR